MFDIKPIKTSESASLLPSKETVERLRLNAILVNHTITHNDCREMCMPEKYARKLAHAWENFKGPVSNWNNFGLSVESHHSKQGYVIMTARFCQGAVHPGVELILDSDEDDDDEETVWKFEAGICSPDGTQYQNRSEEFWREVWTPFMAVSQIVISEPKIQPNAPCPCGSGKKYKKCCFRMVKS